MNETIEQSIEQAGEAEKPFFTAQEARVIGVLMEKQLTVPDTYPLTLNSLTLGCNQKSNREPQMHLQEGEVGHIAKMLEEERGLVRIEYGERAHRFEHKMRSALNLSKEQQAVLTVLLLRGPQTLNDLKARTQRSLHTDDLSEIQSIISSLVETQEPQIAVHLPKSAGQREDRYTHRLCGESFLPSPQTNSTTIIPPTDTLSELVERVDDLEARLTILEDEQNDKDKLK